MANEAEQQELIEKLTALCRRHAGGAEPTPDTWTALFWKYDRDKDGYVSPGELSTLLEDADVGTWFSRDMWVSSIVERVDAANERDGRISLAEFMRTLKHLQDPPLVADGLSRVRKTIDEEFMPRMPSFGDGGVFLLLGIGALVLLSGRK